VSFERDIQFVNAPEERPKPMAASVRIASIALGLFALALLNSRGAFAAAVGVGALAMLCSAERTVTLMRFRQAMLTPQVGMAAAVLAAWIPGVALSFLPWESIQVWIRMTLFVALGVGVYAYFGGRPQALDLSLRTLLAGLALGLLLAHLGASAFPELMVLVRGHHAYSLEHARLLLKAFASAAVVLMPLVLWAGWRLGGRWKWGAIVVALALGLLTVLADSRAGMAGLLGALGIVLAASMSRGRSYRLVAALGLLLVAVVAGILVYLTGRSYAGMVPQSVLIFPAWLVDPHRQVIWQYAVDLATQRPWMGWGINTIALVPPPPGVSPVEFNVPVMPSHPHNWIIEVFAETGLIGGIPMLAAVVLQFLLMLRAYRAHGEPAILAALAASAAFWISGLFNFSFWSAWWQVAYILVLALLYAGRPTAPSAVNTP